MDHVAWEYIIIIIINQCDDFKCNLINKDIYEFSIGLGYGLSVIWHIIIIIVSHISDG